jgi:hypothetical protein
MFITMRYLMCSRLFVLLAVALSLVELADGRIAQSWTYQEMFAKADFVVIARFVSTEDTNERTVLKENLAEPVDVIGVVSQFDTCLILKGPKDVAKFQLHHYRLNGPPVSNGPALVRVNPGRQPAFLLFLVKESGGRYAPVTGQTDPAAFSVLELNGAALGGFENAPPGGGQSPK